MERLEFNLLFGCFARADNDDPVWGHSTSSKNRARLLDGGCRAVSRGAADAAKGEAFYRPCISALMTR
jgi:hypothetical protein